MEVVPLIEINWDTKRRQSWENEYRLMAFSDATNIVVNVAAVWQKGLFFEGSKIKCVESELFSASVSISKAGFTRFCVNWYKLVFFHNFFLLQSFFSKYQFLCFNNVFWKKGKILLSAAPSFLQTFDASWALLRQLFRDLMMPSHSQLRFY